MGGDSAAAPLPRVVPVARARRSMRSTRTVWLVAAGVALLLGGVAAVEGPAVVAWLKGPEPIEPDHEKPAPPTPREVAEKARDAAEKACAGRHWGTCNDALDEATRLDPGGESEERVQRLRGEIHEATTFVPGPDKGGQK